MDDPGTQAAQGCAAAVEASYPVGTDVEVKYPRTKAEEQGDRAAWPWLPGWIAEVCGPDEWEVCVETPELAMERDGETVYPCCFRDASEIRIRS